MIIGIWAEDENRLIGNGDKIPWNVPEDLEFFWGKVEGQKVVCGRKTYQSLKKYGVINKFKQVYVLTKDVNFDKNNILENNVTTWETVDYLAALYKNDECDHLYVVGGASIYKLFEPYYDKVYVTTINGYHKGDTFIDVEYWRMKHVRDISINEDVMVGEFDSYLSNCLLKKHLDNIYGMSFSMEITHLKIYSCLLSALGELSYDIYNHNQGMFDSDYEFVDNVVKDLSAILNLYALYKFKKGEVKELDFNINWIENKQVKNNLTDESNLYGLSQAIFDEEDRYVINQIMTVMLSFGIELEDILNIEEKGCL